MYANEQVYRPSCQGRTVGDCSGCNLAYDCVRARSGRSFTWGIVAFGILAALGMLSQALVG